MRKVNEVAGNFLDCWQKQDWDKMKDWTQFSWVKICPSPVVKLQKIFEHLKLKSYEVKKEKQISETCCDIVTKVSCRTLRRHFVTETVILRVVCEAGYMKPDINGTWGVNPHSLFRKN